MRDEKIYRIPKNLNEEFSLIGMYSILDVAMIVLLGAASTFAVLHTRIYFLFFFPTLYAFLRFKMNGYPVHYWCKVGISYLLKKTTRFNEYTLFEKELNTDGNDEFN
ncbi:hypothetical protein EDD70_0509 [Hydrogenoanaerobacterium saccharovorans]|uniref:Uncharacterized protein n=1 Tax=Hydrogenoanaerobacterium saccharovorans TaxID=474960 RepID=A0A1H8AWF1_9FIRM|nr:hypothetical protein [Hydrogenoanaerobacterium saccharovorans]RPF47710.1 hypothetical protein EDD70_0509 [Hydrogenoanaerobacterium saccharovorans]SEM75005.1 hypothetical protein SAMN05216180_1582 [Hydrogenoanaerobacterium saccharovorans]